MTPSDRERLWAQLGHDEQRVALRFIERLVQGRKAYGELALDHDARDFREEALQEALDLAAYLSMAVERLGPENRPCPRCRAVVTGPEGDRTDEHPILGAGAPANGTRCRASCTCLCHWEPAP